MVVNVDRLCHVVVDTVIAIAPPHIATDFLAEATSLLETNITEKERCRREWVLTDIRKNLVPDGLDPTTKLPGFDLPRCQRTTMNLIRTLHGRCKCVMHKWHIKDTTRCECGMTNKQPLPHLLKESPRSTRFLLKQSCGSTT